MSSVTSNRDMDVGTIWAALSISETAALVGFSHTTVSRVYKERCEKQKRILCAEGLQDATVVGKRDQRRMTRSSGTNSCAVVKVIDFFFFFFGHSVDINRRPASA